ERAVVQIANDGARDHCQGSIVDAYPTRSVPPYDTPAEVGCTAAGDVEAGLGVVADFSVVEPDGGASAGDSIARPVDDLDFRRINDPVPVDVDRARAVSGKDRASLSQD